MSIDFLIYRFLINIRVIVCYKNKCNKKLIGLGRITVIVTKLYYKDALINHSIKKITIIPFFRYAALVEPTLSFPLAFWFVSQTGYSAKFALNVACISPKIATNDNDFTTECLFW